MLTKKSLRIFFLIFFGLFQEMASKVVKNQPQNLAEKLAYLCLDIAVVGVDLVNAKNDFDKEYAMDQLANLNRRKIKLENQIAHYEKQEDVPMRLVDHDSVEDKEGGKGKEDEEDEEGIEGEVAKEGKVGKEDEAGRESEGGEENEEDEEEGQPQIQLHANQDADKQSKEDKCPFDYTYPTKAETSGIKGQRNAKLFIKACILGPKDHPGHQAKMLDKSKLKSFIFFGPPGKIF